MAIYYKELDQHIIVSGKTYPYRERIKQLGGRFQSQSKVWLIPHSQQGLAEIAQLCKRVGGGLLKSPSTEATQAPVAASDITIISGSQTENTAIETGVDPKIAQSTGWSISELLNRVQLTIAKEFAQPIWIIGEVHNLNERKHGLYLQLADLKEGASKSATLTINATVWRDAKRYIEGRQNIKNLTDLLQDGMKIRVMAQVNLYKDRASLSLNILDIDPRYTKGALALQREELLRELRAKGLDRKNASLSLPRFPFRIGFISADGSRAKSDFIDQIALFGCPVQILFFAAQMQGEGTIKAVTQGIDILAKHQCDLIVIARGGGSMADLRWFDNREIALAIAASPIPILAAIGHQDDVCVAEEIAFRREKTPTAAADYIIAHFQQSQRLLEQYLHNMTQQLSQCLHMAFQNWLRLKQALESQSQRTFEQHSLEVDRLTQKMLQAFQNKQFMASKKSGELASKLKLAADNYRNHADKKNIALRNRLEYLARETINRYTQRDRQLVFDLQSKLADILSRQREALMSLDTQLASVDPRPWLAKGWTQLYQEGHLVQKVHDIDIGASLEARLSDGKLDLTVIKKHTKAAKRSL